MNGQEASAFSQDEAALLSFDLQESFHRFLSMNKV
jgi:hypothetical protein